MKEIAITDFENLKIGQAENAGAETKEAVFAPLSDDEIIEL